jgi:hypothetical protein
LTGHVALLFVGGTLRSTLNQSTDRHADRGSLGLVSKLRRIAVVGCAVALALAGCSSEPAPSVPAAPEPTYPNWPTTLDDFRFRWTAEPGIDLLTGAAGPSTRIRDSATR